MYMYVCMYIHIYTHIYKFHILNTKYKKKLNS